MTVVKDTGVGVYQESGGVCTMEAENATVDQRSDNITWITATGHAGYIGSGYMTPPDNTGISVVWSTGCELAWDVEISTAGTYYMAVRRIALDNGDDSARVGVGGSERDDNTFNGEATSWQWSRGTDFDLGNLSVGTHTIQIRRREDGFCIDRVMIADSWSKLPADGSTEAGPAESPTGGEPPDTTPPAPPTGLAATAGDATVSLDWNDNNEPDFDVYDVYRSTSAGGPYSVIDFDLTSSDYIDNTVSNGTTYYYVVTAIDTSLNESGYSNEDSATPTDTTPPAAPAGLAATAGDSQVSLDWADNSEPDLDGYNIFRSTTPGGGYSKLNGSLVSSSDYTDNSVSNDTTYYYVVTAVDTSSNESGYSNEDSATPTDMTPPAAPTGLAAMAGDATVSLDWNDNGEGDLDGYNVYRSTTPGGGYSQLNGSLLSSSDYTDNSVSNGTTYYYVVTAVDTASNESGYSNEDSATPADATPPAAPTGLAATAGDATVSLDWDDNGESDLDGYNVYRSTTPGGGYSQLNGALLSSSDYTDNSVSNDTTYYYIVTAVDTSSNESGYSNEASATPTDTTPPAAPTGLAATAGDATVSLDWNDNGEGDLDGYNVYRSTTQGSGYSKLNGSLLSSSDYTDNNVSNGTTYYYVVTAVDTSSNESGYSGEVSATPQAGPSNAMHVADIAMSTKVAGKNVNGIATVTVVDAGGIPVEGATVSGHWSGLTSDSDSKITLADGTVSISSDKLKNPSGTFTFTVDNITKAGWTYDFAANVETSDSITVP
jgi:fibronectin type 3 domain-containing protein